MAEPGPRDGFIFAATGALYTTLAQRTARNLQEVMPAYPIDLFTDQNVVDPVFDRIHPLVASTRRPKMEALRRSRFRRTVYLDCDVIAACDSSDMFDLLERFDFIVAHDNFRNGPNQRHVVRTPVPAGFSSMNSGVIGVRASPPVTDLLATWEADMTRLKQRWDQPLLRELLYDSQLRIHILPYEYNLMYLPLLSRSSRGQFAPRFLHIPRLHRDPVAPDTLTMPFDLADLLPAPAYSKFEKLLITDRSIGGTADFDKVWTPSLSKRGPGPLRRLVRRVLPLRFREIVSDLRGR